MSNARQQGAKYHKYLNWLKRRRKICQNYVIGIVSGGKVKTFKHQ